MTPKERRNGANPMSDDPEDRVRLAEEVAAVIAARFGLYRRTTAQLLPILAAAFERVREPLLYTSDKQAAAWKDRALTAEAEVARLKAEVEEQRSLRMERVALCDSLMDERDALRAQLSEARADLEYEKTITKRVGDSFDKAMRERNEAQQRVERLKSLTCEMAEAAEEVLRCLLLGTSREQHGLPREEIMVRNPMIESALMTLIGQARAALSEEPATGVEE